MKTQKIKIGIMLLVTLVLASQAYAGRDGGGGNGLERIEAGVHGIEKAIKVQPFFLPMVYQNLKARVNHPSQEVSKNQGLELVKEMAKLPNDEQFVESIQYQVQEEPCLSQGEEKDASAIMPNTICLSINKILQHKYSYEEILSQVTALAVHELSHLMGIGYGRHDEINQLQRDVRWTVGAVTPSVMLHEYQYLANNFIQKAAFLNLKANKNSSATAMCALTSQIFTALTEASDDLGGVNVRVKDHGLAMFHLVEGLFRTIAIQVNGCGLEVVDPVFVVIKNLFQQKSAVTLFEISFGIANSWVKQSEEDYEKFNCSIAWSNCDKEKQTMLYKIELQDSEGIYEELRKVETSYRKYYEIILPQANEAEKLSLAQ